MNLCYYQEKFDADHHQAPVVQKVNSSIHRINHYPLDSAICFPNTYLMNSDYPMGSANHLLNNRGPGVNDDQGMRSIYQTTLTD